MFSDKPGYREKVLDRIERKLDPEGECLIWSGYVAPDGYGKTSIAVTNRNYRSATMNVHTLYFLLKNGYTNSLSIEWHVHHICENPLCCNLDHLELMTSREHKILHIYGNRYALEESEKRFEALRRGELEIPPEFRRDPKGRRGNFPDPDINAHEGLAEITKKVSNPIAATRFAREGNHIAANYVRGTLGRDRRSSR